MPISVTNSPSRSDTLMSFNAMKLPCFVLNAMFACSTDTNLSMMVSG